MSERLLPDVTRELFAWLPQTEQFLSHGAPCFRLIGGRQFGSLHINSHGDRWVSLWLRAAEGVQAELVTADPDQYFVPPYVGPKGWLGVRLDRNPDWPRVAEHVREARPSVAPAKLVSQLPRTPEIPPSDDELGGLVEMAWPRAAPARMIQALDQALP